MGRDVLGSKIMKCRNLAIAAMAVALASCSSKEDAAPTGQVVATVNGQEITKAQLDAEMGDLGTPTTPEQRTAMEQAALQRLVVRQIVADYAKEKKLDGTPLAAILKQRAELNSLNELVQRDLRQKLPNVSAEEAGIYVSDHPGRFSQRKIYVVDQYIVQNATPDLVKAMEPLDTLEQIRALLDQRKVAYNQTVGVIDTLAAEDGVAEKIASLPGGTVFIVPAGNVARVNQVKETKNAPLIGDTAIQAATQLLRNQRANEVMQAELQNIMTKGMEKVKLNPAFEPKQPPKGAPAKAGAPAAAPSASAAAPAATGT